MFTRPVFMRTSLALGAALSPGGHRGKKISSECQWQQQDWNPEHLSSAGAERYSPYSSRMSTDNQNN